MNERMKEQTNELAKLIKAEQKVNHNFAYFFNIINQSKSHEVYTAAAAITFF
jgi:hypothetical protein